MALSKRDRVHDMLVLFLALWLPVIGLFPCHVSDSLLDTLFNPYHTDSLPHEHILKAAPREHHHHAHHDQGEGETCDAEHASSHVVKIVLAVPSLDYFTAPLLNISELEIIDYLPRQFFMILPDQPPRTLPYYSV